MRIVSYSTAESTDRLGVVVGDTAGPDDRTGLQVVDVDIPGPDGTPLNSTAAYVGGFPESAVAVAAWHAKSKAKGIPIADIELGSPVRPTSFLDCSAAPRHLQQASITLFARSAPRPLRPIVRPIVNIASKRVLGRALDDNVLYAKGRTSSFVGDGALVPWPDYTSFLDIEPELAIVMGAVPLGADAETVATAVIGYAVLNDVSARDVQLAEMVGGGLAASKDMDNGNVLGPWLVTPDELADPLGQDVTVTTDRGRRWVGTTADYSMSPVELVTALARKQSIAAGTVIGMGTVADTCGLERDEWLEPGESVAISFSGIGTLNQTLGPAPKLDTRRWGGRPRLVLGGVLR
jgi:2-keto-4-pentenoate hydratase/2-oxohepta-3-ene-1,7-dioic acid hydratase in catechol pathway